MAKGEAKGAAKWKPDALYEVTLTKAITHAGRVINPHTRVELKGKVIAENEDAVADAREIAS